MTLTNIEVIEVIIPDDPVVIVALETGPQGIPGIAGPPGITVVQHGTDPNIVRPTSPVVYWVGTALPANALVYDFWAAI